jgi:SprT protein
MPSAAPDPDLQAVAGELLADLGRRFPLRTVPTLVWKRLRVSAGIAYYRRYEIALSAVVLVRADQVRETLTHEYAHLLAFERAGARGAGHGAEWRQAMRDLGLEPVVHHRYDVIRNRRRQEVGYVCERCGQAILRRRRLPRTRRYVHAGCGGGIQFAYSRAVTDTASNA